MVLTLDHHIVISAHKAAIDVVAAELAKNDIHLGHAETMPSGFLRRFSVTDVPISVSNHGLRDIDVEVLRLLADGLSYRALGLRLGMTEDSAKTCGRRILRTLGARDKANAVYLAYHHGILSADRRVPAPLAPSPRGPRRRRIVDVHLPEGDAQ